MRLRFEFYLSRLDKTDNTIMRPPLFSAESVKNGKWKQSIDAVLTSVEQCAEHLYRFDISMIETLLEQKKGDQVEHLFFPGKNEMNIQQKQTHLSRLIFSHISYIEAFRRYYLWYWSETVPTGMRKQSSELIDDNTLLIAYLIRYLALFSTKALVDSRPTKYEPLLKNPYLKDYTDITYDLYDCDHFNAYLFKYRKTVDVTGCIQASFRKQKLAQIGLLDIILEIHQKGYVEETFFIPIEINND